MDLLDYLLYSNIGFIFLNTLKDAFFFLSSLVLLFFYWIVIFLFIIIYQRLPLLYIFISILYILLFCKENNKKVFLLSFISFTA